VQKSCCGERTRVDKGHSCKTGQLLLSFSGFLPSLFSSVLPQFGDDEPLSFRGTGEMMKRFLLQRRTVFYCKETARIGVIHVSLHTSDSTTGFQPQMTLGEVRAGRLDLQKGERNRENLSTRFTRRFVKCTTKAKDVRKRKPNSKCRKTGLCH